MRHLFPKCRRLFACCHRTSGRQFFEFDTETVPSVAGSGEVTDDDGLSDVDDMGHPSVGEVTLGLEGISASAVARAAMATLDAVDLSTVFLPLHS